MNGVRQSCKRPLNIEAGNTEWNDEEGEHNCSDVQPVAPVSEVSFHIPVTGVVYVVVHYKMLKYTGIDVLTEYRQSL